MKIITFDVLIEIPKGNRNKYEFDNKFNTIRLDRVLHSSVIYPADYGFIPETIAQDGDPIDVLVFLTERTIPNCIIRVKPIGLFSMVDENNNDEKIICVPISDPNYKYINDINEISLHLKKEIEHFFSTYKYLENKIVKIGLWKSKKDAIKLYKESYNRYKQELINKKNK